MRISDWSSDVCSSDLDAPPQPPPAEEGDHVGGRLKPMRRPVGRNPGGAFLWRLSAPAGRCGPAGEAGSPRGLQSPGFRTPRGRCLSRWRAASRRSEEHTSELQSLMRISYAVFCLKKKTKHHNTHRHIEK